MKASVIFFRVALVWAVGAPVHADEKPLVRWPVSDFPPYHMAGPNFGKGIRDRFLRQIQADLSEFAHHTEPSIIARTNALVKAGENVCSVSLLRTPEREAWAVFSARPYAWQLPVRLIALADDKATPALAAHDEIPLADLLRSGKRRLGLQMGRRYGEALDKVVADSAADGVHTESFSADESLLTAVTMMKNGRFDVTLGYAAEAEYLRRHHPEMPALRYFPLAESHALVPLHFACAKNALGERVIAAIDRRPPGKSELKAMRRAYLNYLPDEERRRYAALAGN